MWKAVSINYCVSQCWTLTSATCEELKLDTEAGNEELVLSTLAPLFKKYFYPHILKVPSIFKCYKP
jgi:hypothetical protein